METLREDYASLAREMQARGGHVPAPQSAALGGGRSQSPGGQQRRGGPGGPGGGLMLGGGGGQQQLLQQHHQFAVVQQIHHAAHNAAAMAIDGGGFRPVRAPSLSSMILLHQLSAPPSPVVCIFCCAEPALFISSPRLIRWTWTEAACQAEASTARPRASTQAAAGLKASSEGHPAAAAAAARARLSWGPEEAAAGATSAAPAAPVAELLDRCFSSRAAGSPQCSAATGGPTGALPSVSSVTLWCGSRRRVSADGW